MTAFPDSEPDDFAKITILSDPTEARRVQDEVERLLRASRFTDHEVFGVRLALEEALINAIKHGNQFDCSKRVHISYRVLPERVDIHISDEGCGFDPKDVPDPTTVENLERPSGRGLMLMRHYMCHVSFNHKGNAVTMSKVARNGKKERGHKSEDRSQKDKQH
jgi:serine/threonine-protein kinase RsbW